MSVIGRFKRFVRSRLPVPILEWHQRRANQHVVAKSPREIFSEYYQKNFWGCSESRSGVGSTLEATEVARQMINRLVRELNIQNLLDVPCGDFNWMRHADLAGCHYTGGDIVPDLIEANRKQYSSPQREFRVLNLCQDSLPRADLVLVRDCLIHLCFNDIRAALRKLRASGSTYLLTSTYPDVHKNYDTPTGGARMLNLELAPLKFPQPRDLVRESLALDNSGNPTSKSLGLWMIQDLPV